MTKGEKRQSLRPVTYSASGIRCCGQCGRKRVISSSLLSNNVNITSQQREQVCSGTGQSGKCHSSAACGQCHRRAWIMMPYEARRSSGILPRTSLGADENFSRQDAPMRMELKYRSVPGERWSACLIAPGASKIRSD
jgi:hypothetical protein